MVWAGMRVALQEAIIVQENVESFNIMELQKMLGHMYHVDTEDVACLTPEDYGWPVSRRRQWVIMRHRWKTTAASSPWNVFSKIFQAELWFSMYSDALMSMVPAWDVFFCAEKGEIYAELLWAGSRPDSEAAGACPFTSLEEFVNACATEPAAVQDAFMKALTSAEQTFLLDYRSKRPGQAYALNQNPKASFVCSHQTKLKTLIKNAGLIWQLGFF